MACQTISSIMKSGCEPNNIGGIIGVYINDQEQISGTTVSAATHTITNISLSGTGTVKYATFQFQRNVGNFTVTPTVDLINGTTIFTATISLQFNRREGSKSRALQILSEGQRYLSIITANADGTFSYFDYAQLSGGEESQGQNKTDGSKYMVEFTAQLDQRPYFVSPAIMPPTSSTLVTTT